MYPSEKNPTLSGDIASPELSENQSRLVDMIQSVGRLAMVTSESPITFSVERPDGLQSFLRKVNERVEAGKPMGREEIEELEKKVRYHEVTDKLENRTEVLRLLLGRLHNNEYFKKVCDEVIKETINLSEKRAMSRKIAENTTADNLGL